jgi:hypothetical protein
MKSAADFDQLKDEVKSLRQALGILEQHRAEDAVRIEELERQLSDSGSTTVPVLEPFSWETISEKSSSAYQQTRDILASIGNAAEPFIHSLKASIIPLLSLQTQHVSRRKKKPVVTIKRTAVPTTNDDENSIPSGGLNLSNRKFNL